MNSNFLSAFKELDLNEGPTSENGMKIKIEKHEHLLCVFNLSMSTTIPLFLI